MNRTTFLLPALFVMIAFLFFGAHIASAQNDDDNTQTQYLREAWGVEDGLPVGHVNQICQTPDGYIWMATLNGLVRFDGVDFTIFDVSNTPDLPSNRIIRIQPGRDGALWLFTEQRNLIHFQKGKFTPYGPLLDIENQRVILDGDSVTWVTSAAGILRLRGDTLVAYTFGNNPNRKFNNIVRRTDGAIMLTDIKGHLYVTRYPYQHLKLLNTPKIENYPNHFRPDPTGTYWLSTEFLVRYESDSIEIINLQPDLLKGWSGHLPFYFAQHRGPDGNLYFLTETGLYSLDSNQVHYIQTKYPNNKVPEAAMRQGAGMYVSPDGSVWTVLDTSVFKNGELQFTLNAPANTVFVDREKSIWITNQQSGVQRFSKTILSHYRYPGKSANYYGVFQDSKGIIWFGTWSNSVFFMTEDNQIHELKNSEALGVTAAFAEELDGTMHIGYFQSIDSKNAEYPQAYVFERVTEINHEVFAIYASSDSSLWYGTSDGLYRRKAGKLSKISDSDSTADYPVRFILETTDKNLWLATNGSGIRHYNYETGINTYITKADGLSSNNIRALLEGEHGNIWVATEDRGLNYINLKTGRIDFIGKKDGLYSESLNALLRDDFGRLWLSTNEGIFWVQFDELKAFVKGEVSNIISTVYTERDGMLNRETNGGFQNSALKSDDGRLWFVTQEGLVSIDPSKLKATQPLLPALIEDFYLNGQSLDIQNGTIVLKRDQSNFRIKYTVPTFRAPNRVRFKYKLVGFDTKWVDSGHSREAVYTNIPAGRYTFKVSAFYNPNRAETTTTELIIIKEPKLSETVWFWLIMMVLLVLLLYGIFRWRIHKLRMDRAILEKVVRQRTHDLESEKQITELQKDKLLNLHQEKNRFFANISHEFRTPLTLIIDPLSELLRNPNHGGTDELQRRQIKISLKNAKRLMRLVEHLLDLAKLEAGHFDLNLKEYQLNGYVRELADSFHSLAEVRDIDFEIKIPETEIVCRFDPEYLDKIIVNLLSNAFKFTPPGGRILFELSVADSTVEISVSDTGIGIELEKVPHLFDRFYQIEKSELQPGTGIGLSIAKELAELHEGTITVESQKERGSTFAIILPSRENVKGIQNPETLSFTGHSEPEKSVNSHLEYPQSEPLHQTHLSGLDDRITLLIVDDNADIRQYIADGMDKRYRSIVAKSGNEAFESIKKNLPDVVISDLMMSDGNGLELLQKIRNDENYSFIPFILLTAKAEIEYKLEGLRIGADDYISKPFAMNELRARVDNILDSRKRLKNYYREQSGVKMDPKIQFEYPQVESQDAEFIREVTLAIQKNYTDESFTVEAMAKYLGLSRSNLYRKLMALTGEKPSAMLKRVRLEHAAILLKENAGTVSEVAYASGFNSIAHFSKSFSDAYGMSPTSYSAN